MIVVEVRMNRLWCKWYRISDGACHGSSGQLLIFLQDCSGVPTFSDGITESCEPTTASLVAFKLYRLGA